MRIAIITDIHEDFFSLQEAFRKIDRCKVDEIVCLGDISGFSVPYYAYHQTRNAHKCLELIRSKCKFIVLGNHDIHVAKIIPQKGHFFEFPNNWYDMDYHQRHKLGGDKLWLHEEDDLDPLYKQEDLEFLRSLPEYLVLKVNELSILFSHYIYPNLSGLKREFYTYKDEFRQHFEFMESLKCSVSITGHSHTKGFFTSTPKHYHQFKYLKKNLKTYPVCVGIPPITSHKKRSGFCIFDSDQQTIQIIRLKNSKNKRLYNDK